MRLREEVSKMMVKTRKRTSLRLSACPRCGGSAYLESAEENEWRCLQCGRPVPMPGTNEHAARRLVA
jgi:tRNA(Ile2) C34 agmatinyltransferase TiaS